MICRCFNIVLCSSYAVDLIGTEEVYSCQLRGDPVEGNSDYLLTCSVCQAIRTMPKEYWPTELGEIICKSDDKYCFIDNKIRKYF